MIVYGPVPSRRLGQSLGINHIPPKKCSYSCIYCQIGRTDKMRIQRTAFYDPADIYRETAAKVRKINEMKQRIDYLSFVPDGEPTLDIHLGKEIKAVKALGLKTAVITNASLLWMDEVKRDLMYADWVSVKLDAADEDTWRKIDRPHRGLRLDMILGGIVEFSKAYQGTLVTETMLVDGINDKPECIEKIAGQLALISPDRAYLMVPIRPPVEQSVKRPSHTNLAQAYALLRDSSGIEIACITGDEGEEGFFFSDIFVKDLLDITSVHPVREEIVAKLLKDRNVDHAIVDALIKEGQITAYWYEGKKFYKRNR